MPAEWIALACAALIVGSPVPSTGEDPQGFVSAWEDDEPDDDGDDDDTDDDDTDDDDSDDGEGEDDEDDEE